MNEERDELFIHEGSMPENMDENLSNLNLEDNNISGRIAHLRDTFISAEEEYVFELLKNESIREMIREVNWHSSRAIFEEAQKIVDQVENNLIPYEEMERVEIKLVILLAAIKDKVLVKELIYEFQPEENTQGLGRSR